MIRALVMKDELPGDSIKNLGLSSRTYYALFRAKIRRISVLAEMSDNALLQIYQIGPNSVSEIKHKIQSHLYPLKNSLKTAESALAQPNEALTLAHVDLPLYEMPIEVLPLSRRTLNALTRSALTTLGHVSLLLEEFHSTKIVSVRNIGVKGIRELESCFDKYLSKLKSDQQQPATIQSDSLQTGSSENSESQYPYRRWEKLLQILQAEISQELLRPEVIVGGFTLADLITSKTIEQGELHLRYFSDLLASVLIDKTICDELVRLSEGVSKEHLEIFYQRMGPKKITLEELGDKKGVTRERVRQITNKVKRSLRQRILKGSYLRLQTALYIATEMEASISYSVWLKKLTTTGLLGKWPKDNQQHKFSGLTPGGLLIAVCKLINEIVIEEGNTSLSTRFKVSEYLTTTIDAQYPQLSAEVIKKLASLPKETKRAIRKQARNGGAVNIHDVAQKLGLTIEDARLVLVSWKYKSLSDDWYIVRPPKNLEGMDRHWAVAHTVLKMMKFCGPLEINEICNGLRRHMSRGGHSIPPPAIMEQVLVALGFQINGGRASWPFENISIASKSENIILDTLGRFGPVISHFELVQAFTQAGLSLPALSVTLKHSPLFAKVEMGVYKLRGKAHTHGDLEKVQQRQPVTAAEPEVAFDLTGNIRFRINLGSMAVTSGVIVTSHLPNLSGRWTSFVDDLACGSITIRDTQIWSLTKSLRCLNAQVGERIELNFDTWKHIVTVSRIQNET